MNLYLAPMEGITGYVFRNAYHKYYEPMDKYFSPFVSHIGLSHRELQDVLPEHNQNIRLVPQILTNKAEEFISIAGRLAELGYKEVNLNLGCPSGTIIKKKRGSGMLSDPALLESFLTEIYSSCSLRISIKTRLGLDSPEEWPQILEIYNKFPVSELILHPRIQKDFYKKPVRPEWFAYTMTSARAADCRARVPLCYNGDIFTPAGFKRFHDAFPDADAVMLGRGILKNPELAADIRRAVSRSEAPPGGHISNAGCREHDDPINAVPGFIAAADEYMPFTDKDRFLKFHCELLDGYRHALDGDKNVLFKMKELWFYVGQSFPESKKQLKLIKKSQSIAEYENYVRMIFRR